MPPFHFPFFYSSNYYNKYNSPPSYNNFIDQSSNPSISGNEFTKQKNIENQLNLENPKLHDSQKTSNENYFFELFGLTLYFDDILLMCLLFFLYNEGVKDDELFISLVLLLLS